MHPVLAVLSFFVAPPCLIVGACLAEASSRANANSTGLLLALIFLVIGVVLMLYAGVALQII